LVPRRGIAIARDGDALAQPSLPLIAERNRLPAKARAQCRRYGADFGLALALAWRSR
jgi:hypothetical protein